MPLPGPRVRGSVCDRVRGSHPPYHPTTRCPVLTYGMLLPGTCSDASGKPVRFPGELRYLPTRGTRRCPVLTAACRDAANVTQTASSTWTRASSARRGTTGHRDVPVFEAVLVFVLLGCQRPRY
eukprot:3856120-Rhodomonas_salina.1